MPMVRQTCVYKPRLPKYMSRSQSVLVPYQLSASSYATEGDKGQRQKLGQMDRERTGTKTGTEGRGRRQMVIGTEGQGQRDMRARDRYRDRNRGTGTGQRDRDKDGTEGEGQGQEQRERCTGTGTRTEGQGQGQMDWDMTYRKAETGTEGSSSRVVDPQLVVDGQPIPFVWNKSSTSWGWRSQVPGDASAIKQELMTR